MGVERPVLHQPPHAIAYPHADARSEEDPSVVSLYLHHTPLGVLKATSLPYRVMTHRSSHRLPSVYFVIE